MAAARLHAAPAHLTSEAASKWNGQIGKVVSFDHEAGRYVLEMTREEQLRIKPANLVF